MRVQAVQLDTDTARANQHHLDVGAGHLRAAQLGEPERVVQQKDNLPPRPEEAEVEDARSHHRFRVCEDRPTDAGIFGLLKLDHLE